MKDIQEKIRLAQEYAASKNYPAAIALFQEILKKEDKNPTIFLELGKIYLEQKMWEEALYYFLRAEVLKPSYEVYFQIATLFYKKQNYKKAIEYFEKSEKISKTFEAVWNKALCYEKLKQKKEAALQYIQAYEIQPKEEMCFKLAPYCLEAGLYREAIRFYQIIANKEQKPLYYAEMGLAYMELGEYEESKKCYQKAKELSHLAGKYPAIEEMTYEDFVKKYDNIEEKIAQMVEKIKEGIAEYYDHYDLGNMFFIQGDYQKSIEQYKKARDIYMHQLVLRL